MATNKPPTPEVHYFSTAMYATCFVALVTFIPMWYNVKPVGDLPAWNWLIWLVCFGLAFGGRWLQVVLIRKRVEPKWNCPDIEPWSDPLQMSIEKYAGGVVDFWSWYCCSSGLTLQKAEEALKDPARKHQVEHQYSLYLTAYGKAYG